MWFGVCNGGLGALFRLLCSFVSVFGFAVDVVDLRYCFGWIVGYFPVWVGVVGMMFLVAWFWFIGFGYCL